MSRCCDESLINTIRLGKVVDVVDTLHATAPLSEFETEYKMIRTSDIREGVLNTNTMRSVSRETYDVWTRRSKLEVGDIILSREAPMGEVGKVIRNDVKYFLGQRTLRLKTTDSSILDQEYLYQVLKSDFVQKQLRVSDRTGSNVGNIRIPVLKETILPLPDIPTQTAIGIVLSNIDNKIELNRKINEELEKIANIIYDYWFVGFNFPNKEGKPYRSSGGVMTYSNDLNRDIPEGWGLGNIYESSLHKIIKTGIVNFDNEKIYYDTKQIGKNGILGPGEKVTQNNKASRANMQPTKNSIWFAKMKGSVKHIFLSNIYDDILEGIFSTGMVGLKVDENAFAYLASFIKFSDFENKKNDLSHGATQQAVNNEDIKQIKFVIPDHQILIKFTKQVLPLFIHIQQNQKESVELAKIRDWLLPLLINEQVWVSSSPKTVTF